MQIFQFLIIPQYVLGGVLVPLRGTACYLDVVAHLMPMRYVVELTRAAFYAGTPGYRQVVSGRPLLDAVVAAALFAVLMVAGCRGVRLPRARPADRQPLSSSTRRERAQVARDRPGASRSSQYSAPQNR